KSPTPQNSSSTIEELYYYQTKPNLKKMLENYAPRIFAPPHEKKNCAHFFMIFTTFPPPLLKLRSVLYDFYYLRNLSYENRAHHEPHEAALAKRQGIFSNRLNLKSFL